MRIDRIALHGLTLAAVVILGTAGARAENAATGVWIDHTGRGAVEITECDGNKLCGHVAWVDDEKNSDQCGKQIIGNAKPVGRNKWDNGWIYDPDSGSKYDVELTPSGDKMKVVGYAGTKWLSQTFTWKRAPADLRKCGDKAERAAVEPTPAASTAEDEQRTDKSTEASADKADTDRGDVLKEARTDPVDEPSDSGKAKRDADETPRETKKPRERDSAKADEDSDADEPKGSGKPAVARIMERLEAGDTPIKVTRKGKKCTMTVPYVDMVVTVPCED